MKHESDLGNHILVMKPNVTRAYSYSVCGFVVILGPMTPDQYKSKYNASHTA